MAAGDVRSGQADLDAILSGLLGGVGGGLQKREDQKSPEAIGTAVDIQTKMATLDEARQRIDLAHKQAGFDLKDRQRKDEERARQTAAIERIRGSGEMGAKLADLMEAQLTQPSGGVQEAYLGIPDRATAGGDTRANYEYALKQGYRGSLIDFIQATKTTPKAGAGAAKKPPMTIVQARNTVKQKVNDKIKELQGNENEWISETDYRALSSEERKQFHGPVLEGADQGTPYYRPRPDVQDSVKQLKAYLRDESAVKRGADSLLQVWSQDNTGAGSEPGAPAAAPAAAEDVSKFTPKQSYDKLKQMGVTGLEGLDPNDPDNTDLLRYYLENPDAFNK